ncbi:uncharacterized protein RSE6_12162 [Rhynchosporium secalis]|uniref:Uncharacterized protein n=1 Tax=Rhynchosporium secalis TaxID=38038 RepID=A0A1E1MPP3_RHYSE|nr:uncharacterized protein RSE6_12162 [Rhynchosporium secalis]
MSSPRTRIFTSLARMQHFRQIPKRQYSNSSFQALPRKIVEGAKGDWSMQGKRIVTGLQLYVPLVACLMFWPYAVALIMQEVQMNM